MNANSPAASQHKQQQALNAFLDKLLVAYKANIVKIYLFGSQACGKVQPDSDMEAKNR